MSNPAVVPTSDPGSFGICIAFGQDTYTSSPTWTRLDDPTAPRLSYKAASPHNCNCVADFAIDRGRAYEWDKTEAGTATLTLLDPNGLFDPTNPNSPFYLQIVPNLQAKISIQNPHDAQYYDLFSGFVESWDWTFQPRMNMMIAKVVLNDGFEPIERAELQPDGTGKTTFAGTSDVKTRIDAILDLAGWPSVAEPSDPRAHRWRNVNTGNVLLPQTIYNAQTSALSAIQDAADGEFPGVANFFISKKGAATFYGRYPRFQPTNYPGNVNFWQVADRSGAQTFGAAALADIEIGLDVKNLINAALCYPQGASLAAISGQLYTDPVSIAKFGLRSKSLPDLVIDGQPAGGGISSQPSATALEVCLFYAQYYVVNYANPAIRISRMRIKTQPATDFDTWAFVSGVEIGDLCTVFTRHPGGGGLSKETDQNLLDQFFVEGIHYKTQPLSGKLHDFTLDVDVSPRTWFTTDPWAS